MIFAWVVVLVFGTAGAIGAVVIDNVPIFLINVAMVLFALSALLGRRQ